MVNIKTLILTLQEDLLDNELLYSSDFISGYLRALFQLEGDLHDAFYALSEHDLSTLCDNKEEILDNLPRN